jgi:hypothetical protein
MIYLASPNTQQQAEHVAGMPVLLSFACYSPWLDRYQASFKRILIDSGAYSEMNSGKQIDLSEYADWCERWRSHADAVAGLDDIRGDWRKSLANYEAFTGGFPTMHDTDPPELLDELIAICTERKQWLGIGLMPPRHNKEAWIRDTLDRVPESIHVHGWALRAYSNVRRLDSIDSTNWWRDGMDLAAKLPWLTYGECLEIVVKRYERETRKITERSTVKTLFN